MKHILLSGKGLSIGVIGSMFAIMTFSFALTREVSLSEEYEKGMSKEISNSKVSACGLYESIRLDSMGLSRQAFESALEGFFKLKDSGALFCDDHITVIDFSLPSVHKRLFLIDLKEGRLVLNTYVAHGQGSGWNLARNFSNRPSSYQSSLGFFRTADTYQGKQGYSLKLEGLEKGINHLADERAIVLHGASYVSERYIRKRGILGRSQGCPAVPESCHRMLIDLIKEGQCLFIYAPDKQYLSRSRILNA
jgi:hypothetical protein